MTEDPNSADNAETSADLAAQSIQPRHEEFATISKSNEYTDGRVRWDWQSKYPDEARREIKFEAWFLMFCFVVIVIIAAVFLSIANIVLQIPVEWQVINYSGNAEGASARAPFINVNFRIVAIFFVGMVGGTTFSIKWLVHSTAKGWWHRDRRYWRLLTPFLGGVYACVVLTLFDAGFFGSAQASVEPRAIIIAAALAFLIGYFSDGVSGLLSNVANAVFGTLDKK